MKWVRRWRRRGVIQPFCSTPSWDSFFPSATYPSIRFVNQIKSMKSNQLKMNYIIIFFFLINWFRRISPEQNYRFP
jgi:hypothetical protein